MTLKVGPKFESGSNSPKLNPKQRNEKSHQDQTLTTISKLAVSIPKLNFEIQGQAQELLINNVLTKLPGGDGHSAIEALAKLLINEMSRAQPEDIVQAQKTLLHGGFLDPMLKKEMTRVNAPENLLQSQFIVPQSIVKIEFDEKTYTHIDQNLKKLFSSIDSLKNALEQQIKSVSGSTSTLLPSSSNYEQLKEEALKMFEAYKTNYNNAVTCLNTIKVEEDAVVQLQNQLTKTIQEFTSLNHQRITFLTNLFSEIGEAHDHLDDKNKHGYVTYSTRIWGGSSVKRPTLQNISDRYVVALKEEEIPQIKFTEENFSTLFQQAHKFYLEINKFSDNAFEHLAEVIRTNKVMISSNPNLEQEKKKATDKLPEIYQKLHDQCLDTFSQLQKLTEDLKNIELLLTERANKQLKDILNRRTNLVILTNTLESSYKGLDRAIHNGLEEKTKEFKKLTETTVELMK